MSKAIAIKVTQPSNGQSRVVYADTRKSAREIISIVSDPNRPSPAICSVSVATRCHEGHFTDCGI